MPTKNNFLFYFFCLLLLKVNLHLFSKIKSKKKSQNSRNQGFSYYFCMMVEGSRSGSIPVTNGSWSGSRRPNNMWIRWIRIRIWIRIRNTVCRFFQRLNWGSNSLWGAAIANLGLLNIGQLQVLPAYRQPDTRFCKPYASLILTLASKAPLWTNKALAASSSSFIVVKICSAFDLWGLTKLSH
jgi:hypothetical protein